MYHFSWLIRIVALALIVEFPAWASHIADNVENKEDMSSGLTRTKLADLEAKYDNLVSQIQALQLTNANLKDQLAFKPWKDTFDNTRQPDAWTSYTNKDIGKVQFYTYDMQRIAVFRPDFSESKLIDYIGVPIDYISLPEDGVYSFVMRYGWRNVSSYPCYIFTAIAINDPTYYTQAYVSRGVPAHCEDNGTLNLVTSLKKGDKIMISIIGNERLEYNLQRFGLTVERIH